MDHRDNARSSILDLPDEILLCILKELTLIDAFHSLVDVNRRFHQLILDPLYIRNLDLTDPINVGFLCEKTSSINIRLLSKIRDEILPRIHHLVYQLTLEQCAMNEVLRAGNYSQLSSFSLLNCDQDLLFQSLTGDAILRDLLHKQITHLSFGIGMRPQREWESKTAAAHIFASILSLCPNLIDLNIYTPFFNQSYSTVLFHLPLNRYVSSTLTRLRIDLESLADCIFLLDGRFSSLVALIVQVKQIFPIAIDMNAIKPMLKLTSFSFTTLTLTSNYDDMLVPLLRRMVNLKELRLHLLVWRTDPTYIDGNQLHDQFLVHMTRLKKFSFHIKTQVYNAKCFVNLPSNEDIRRSFAGRYAQKMQTCVHTEIRETEGDCRVYSMPYDFEYFVDLSNTFAGGTFRRVRHLTMEDNDRPFEPTLFRLVSRSFPFLQSIHVCNHHRQENKGDVLTPVTFPYLVSLHLKDADMDYVELFLLKKNMCVPLLLSLSIEGNSLKRLTKNFTDDTSHFNFKALRSLDVWPWSVSPERLRQFFPSL